MKEVSGLIWTAQPPAPGGGESQLWKSSSFRLGAENTLEDPLRDSGGWEAAFLQSRIPFEVYSGVTSLLCEEKILVFLTDYLVVEVKGGTRKHQKLTASQ